MSRRSGLAGRALSSIALVLGLAGPTIVKAAPPEVPLGPLSESQQQRLNQAVQKFDQAKHVVLRAVALREEGNYAEAQGLLERMLPTMEALVGADAPEFAEVLNQLASVYMRQGKYAPAESYFLRALQIFQAAQGAHSAAVGSLLNNLGILHAEQGDAHGALSYYEQGLRTRQAVLGPSSPEVAASLYNMARQHTVLWSFERAVPLFLRALQIQEAAFGADDLRVAGTLVSLAEVYARQGAYERAEPLQVRALRIAEQRLGPNHPDLATTRGAIAELYVEAGDYARAALLLQRAVEALGNAQGKNRLQLAKMLSQLARIKLQLRMGGQTEVLKQSELLLQRAIQLAEGLDASEVGRLQCRLGEVYLLLGDPARALKMLGDGLQLESKGATWSIGSAEPDGVHLLAVLMRDLGRPRDALTFEKEALSLRQRTQGDNHPGVAQSYQTLAALHALLGQNEEAARMMWQSLQLTEQRLRTQGLVLSESRLAQLLALLREQEEQIYSLLLRTPANKDLRRLALTTLLLRKGRSVDELALRSLVQSQVRDRADQQRFATLREIRGRLAHVALLSSEQLPPAQRDRLFLDLSAQAEGIEQDLATRHGALRDRRRTGDSSQLVTKVAATLQKDAVLVEIVAFTERPPEQKLAAPKGPLHYLAFVLARDSEPMLVDLGLAAPLEATAARLQAALSNPQQAYLSVAQDAYRSLFAPLLPALGDRHRVVISADGVLDLVPFAALHDKQGFVLGSYDVSYVTAGRDLLRGDPAPTAPARIVVMADPVYTSTTPGAAVSGARGTARSDRGIQLGALRPLPGTRQEAQAIQKLWPQAQLLLGRDASEPALLGLAAPTILHIATHGLFVADTPPPAAPRRVGPDRGFGTEAEPLPPNPLLRSALVLAGAQDSFGATAAGSPIDATTGADGLATALEVSSMNLWGTQLVVLSACESGRGQVQVGQGVYGLRRAFQAAGAETLVTTLWRINDHVTVDLMTKYYQGLHAGASRVGALRAAAQAIAVEHPHPYYWASFLALGLDAPLSKM